MVEADAIRQARVVVRRGLGLHELSVRQLQERLAVTELATDLELQQLIAALPVEERRRDVAGLRTAAGGQLVQPLDGDAWGEAPRAADREAAGEARGIDTADLGVAVGEGEDVEVVVAEQVRTVELRLVVEERAGGRLSGDTERGGRRADLRGGDDGGELEALAERLGRGER